MRLPMRVPMAPSPCVVARSMAAKLQLPLWWCQCQCVVVPVRGGASAREPNLENGFIGVIEKDWILKI